MKRSKSKIKEKVYSEFMTPQEIADYLGFTRRTIYEKASTREIPGIKLFGSWRFRKSDIDKWIKSHSNAKRRR